MSYGTKFRPNFKINSAKALSIFLVELNSFIISTSYRFSTPIQSFFEWKEAILANFKHFLDDFLNRSSHEYHFFNRELKSLIESLKVKYVFCPVDKAASNFAIICKSFYAHIISKELNTETTYKVLNTDIKILIKKYIAFSKKTKLKVDTSASIPFLFATPKFHKNPIGFRFICSNVNSIGNNFNCIFEKFLKKILNILKFKYKNNSGFWILDNSFGVIDDISTGTVSVQTYDFENLFTNIPIKKLFDVIIYVFDSISSDLEDISRDIFVNLCHFCLHNNYVFTGSKIYQQINGIGMGTSYSSTAANIFLFFYEHKFCTNLNHLYNFKAYRYIDDLIILNADFDFSNISNLIYPDCLILKKVNDVNRMANFLDLRVDLNHVPPLLSVYDKRCDFPFKVISLVHWSSNMSKKIYINTILSQFFRFFKICNNRVAFEKQIFYFSARLFYDCNIPLNFIHCYLPSLAQLHF